jgi:hypothetical protein
MPNSDESQRGVSAEQIQAEYEESARRSQASAKRIARPVKVIANVCGWIWTALVTTCS